jgi:ParB-like chromosome segregation protein Spo0J
VKIPIRDIAIINRQRQEMDLPELQKLANSILMVEKMRGEGNGLIHPINVRPVRPDDLYDQTYNVADLRGQPVRHQWILVTGGRRTAAHAMLGRTEIEARNFEDLDPLDREVVELEENISRKNLTWQEELAAKARIHELRQMQAATTGEVHTQKDTAKELGESTANLSKDLQLHNLMKTDPSLKKASSKKAAIRAASHKVEIANRVASLSQNSIQDLGKKLHTMDMRDFVRTLPDRSVDLHFPDFPFGIDYDKSRPNADNMRGGYEDRPEALIDLLTDVVPHLVRSVKPTGWIAAMMGFTNYQFMAGLFRTACATHAGYCEGYWNEIGEWEPLLQKGQSKPYCNASPLNMRSQCRFLKVEELPWIWFRPNSRQPSLYPERHANNTYEMFCVVNGGEARLVRPNVPNVLMFDAVYTNRIHEMQRPHELCKEVISRLTVTGEKVVDVCYGSGAHLAAAAELARDFEGCDNNPANRGSAIVHVAQYYKPDSLDAAKRGLANSTLKTPPAKPELVKDEPEDFEDLSDLTDEEIEGMDLGDDEEDETPEINFDGRSY